MDLNLRNRVALVTGGSRGSGRAIVLGLAAEGARVAIHYYRNPDGFPSAASRIRPKWPTWSYSSVRIAPGT